MNDRRPKLELRDVLIGSAAEISNARSLGRAIHRTRDIRAAGNEVERKVREVIARWLPVTAEVGHGHVIDENWHASLQLDVILANRTFTASLFRTEDGTDYYPYETVYGFGEVKTTFDSSRRPVESFSEAIRSVREGLSRQETPPNWIPGFSLGDGLSVSGALPYRNPLLTFMLFAEPGDFDPEDLREHYRRTPTRELPAVVVVLGHGVITCAGLSARSEGGVPVVDHLTLSTSPEFSNRESKAGRNASWLHLPLGQGEGSSAACLGFLYATILAHLEKTVLMPPDLFKYMWGVFDFKAGGQMVRLADVTNPPQSR
jgi:hypothetical protein